MTVTLAVALPIRVIPVVLSASGLGLVAIAPTQSATASVLSFAQEQQPVPSTVAAPPPTSMPHRSLTAASTPRLPIPPSATDAPIGSGHTLTELPPPPRAIVPAPVASAPVALQSSPPPPPVAAAPDAKPTKTSATSGADGLRFNLQTRHSNRAATSPSAINREPALPPAADEWVTGLPDALQPLFVGGSQSLVAIAIGHAEGTRTPNGDITAAYFGHLDPGNGKHNLGTFSYQHGAASPAAADAQQLRRLQHQAIQLWQAASARGVTLSLAEWLNALDLANQSPEAALAEGGYLDRLQAAKRLNLSGEEAIAWARTRAYLDPDTRQWNAPGLGNTLATIAADQERRLRAIAKVIDTNPTARSQPAPASVERLLSLNLSP